MEKEKLERICFNCNQFSPANREDSEFGICLNDEAFEPFLHQLLENLNYSCCQDLINRKKISGDQGACPDFKQSELIEIDDDSPLGRELSCLCETQKLDSKTLKDALFEHAAKDI